MLLMEVSFLLLLCLSAAADKQGIKVKHGDEATLPCHYPSPGVLHKIEWTRLEQKSNGYVFVYRKTRGDLSFRGRAEPRDPEVKKGNGSLTLKNVTVNDAGTYNCTIISQTENGKVTKFSILVSLIVPVSW
ncbi:unnamed protein product [Pleuronectes platessa]|uniref:Ig-like domain-containing protein n=1 Tax=Pleuronectes platessa TaxID=8262 RepID=A0A9N7UZD4_PLEPL|nr:unnamed protein product [Pleuronectes platessa]